MPLYIVYSLCKNLAFLNSFYCLPSSHSLLFSLWPRLSSPLPSFGCPRLRCLSLVVLRWARCFGFRLALLPGLLRSLSVAFWRLWAALGCGAAPLAGGFCVRCGCSASRLCPACPFAAAPLPRLLLAAVLLHWVLRRLMPLILGFLLSSCLSAEFFVVALPACF